LTPETTPPVVQTSEADQMAEKTYVDPTWKDYFDSELEQTIYFIK